MNKRIVLIAGCLATRSAIVLAHAAQGKRPLRVVQDHPQFALRACERLIARKVIPRDLRVSLPAVNRAFDAMRASGQISAESTLPIDIVDTRWLDRAEAIGV